ncbi:MAG: hypothetical protein NTW83_06625, partial [Cyanobacteria bacterium]|nr:hypothetical protein [Cyanobacteriota bacterium]
STLLNYHQLLDANAYQVNEWMINYQGGFARRGLSGELLLAISRALGPLDLGAMALLLSGLAVWGFALIGLRRLASVNLPVAVAVAYSPLLYPMFLHWDPNGVARKDVLALLFVMALLALSRQRSRAVTITLLVGGGLAVGLLTLVHEALFVFCMPVWLIISALYLRRLGLRWQALVLWLALAALPSLLALSSVALWGAVPAAANVEAMCVAWQALHPQMICDPLQPALDAVTNPQDYVGDIGPAWADWRQYRRLLLLLTYMGALFTVVLPLVLASGVEPAVPMKRLRLRSAWIAAFCLLPTLPLYAVSTDYGRWLSTAATAACLILLGGDHLFPGAAQPAGGEVAAGPGQSGRATHLLQASGIGFCVLIALFAYIKHCCTSDFILVNERSAFTAALRILLGQR